MKAYSTKDLWAYEDMLYTLQSALSTAKVYEVFTKDEVIAMLTGIRLEIEENVLADDPNALLPFLQARETCVAIIQQKINALKGNEDADE